MGDWGEPPFPGLTKPQENDLRYLAMTNGLRQLPGFTLPSTQKAVISPKVTSTLNLAVLTVPVRQPLANEVIVRVCYTWICRSDACFSTGLLAGYPTTDHIAGHEGIGHVVKAGTPELFGRFVGLRYRAQPVVTAHTVLKEYLTVPANCLLLIPDELINRAPEPAMLCGALCSGAAALVAVHAQSVVVVVGAGGAIGHYAASISK
ncbi:chaperonin 10-like protein [Achaetomium macrosporum]|uniref:Chaperonin 10-like protein n=1 Tax=Achaetomium macrosporum TaxID=79813 RepID=A0AAN7C4V4_9PEZI|nr:chaperonin 10-like protein [Achaetomium macrosporum]